MTFEPIEFALEIISAKKNPTLYLWSSARSSLSSFLLQPTFQTTKSHYKSLQRAHIHIQSIIPSIQHASGDRCAVKTYRRVCGNAYPSVLASPTSISIDSRRYYLFDCSQASPLSIRSSSYYKVRSRSSVLEAEGDLWSAHCPLSSPKRSLHTS